MSAVHCSIFTSSSLTSKKCHDQVFSWIRLCAIFISNCFNAIEDVKIDEVRTADACHDGKPATIYSNTAKQNTRQHHLATITTHQLCLGCMTYTKARAKNKSGTEVEGHNKRLGAVSPVGPRGNAEKILRYGTNFCSYIKL